MSAPIDLPEAMHRIQDQLRSVNDAGHKFADPDVESLSHIVASLADVVDALVHVESVPSQRGVAIS